MVVTKVDLSVDWSVDHLVYQTAVASVVKLIDSWVGYLGGTLADPMDEMLVARKAVDLVVMMVAQKDKM